MFERIAARFAAGAGALTVMAALLLSLPNTSQAETLLSLDQAIEIALEKGYEMKSHKLSLFQAEQNRLAAKYRFRTNVNLNMEAPRWAENMQEVPVPNGLPVYNSRGTKRFQGMLDIRQPLPTDGYLSFRSRLYESRESNYFADTENTIKRKDFLTSFSIWFNQPLFTFNRIKTNLKRAELNYERQSLTLKRNELDVVYSVTNAFFSLYHATRSYEIAGETQAQQQLQYDTAKMKYEAGLIPEVEALRLEVDLATANSDFEEVRASLEREKESFRKLIGLSIDANAGVSTDTNYDSFEVALEEAIRIGLNNRTELREQEINIELSKLSIKEIDAQSEVKANFSAYYDLTGRSDPDLMYNTGSRDLFDSSIDDLERRPGNRGVTFTVDIPIWDWGVNKSEVASAKAELRRAELQKDEGRKDIITSIRDAVRQLKSTENRLKVLEKSQVVAQRTYDISLERFNNGEITSLDLAQDNKSLSSTKMSYLSSYIQYRLAVADLKRKTLYDFEAGKELFE